MNTSPQTLTVTECHQLLDALLPKDCTAKQHKKAIRNYTMALLMLDAGLRVGEVVSLYWQDLYYFDHPVESVTISVAISKTHTQRIVPLSSRLRSAIQTMYEAWWIKEDQFFTANAFYGSNHEKPITTRQVERIINAAAWRAIGRPVHPHVLRHTFASRLMRTVNSRIVQELLGHKHLTSTQIYTHPNGEDLKNAINSIEDVPPIRGDNQDPLFPGAGRPDRIDTPAAHHH